MYVFDQKLLQQYVDAGAKLMVYADSEWYNITSLKDLSDNVTLVAYDENGGAHYPDYTDVQQIQVNGKTYTLDMMQAYMTGKPPEEGGDKPAGGGDTASPDEEPPTDEEPAEDKPEKEPDLSWFSRHYDLGRKLLQETKKGKRK